MLFKLRSFLTQDQLLMVYHAFIQSHINYAIVVWGLTTQTNLQKVKIVQNKALRIIASLPSLTNVDHLYSQFNIMHVYCLIHYKICYSTWLLIQNPSLIPSVKLKFISSSYKTRAEVNLKLENFSFFNNFGRLHFLHVAYYAWNLLPLNLRCERNSNLFRNALYQLMVCFFSVRTRHKLLLSMH